MYYGGTYLLSELALKTFGGGKKGGVRDVNQLLAIVRSEHNIGQDEKRSIIMSIENGD
jgi:hypothetical protein